MTFTIFNSHQLFNYTQCNKNVKRTQKKKLLFNETCY